MDTAIPFVNQIACETFGIFGNLLAGSKKRSGERFGQLKLESGSTLHPLGWVGSRRGRIFFSVCLLFHRRLCNVIPNQSCEAIFARACRDLRFANRAGTKFFPGLHHDMKLFRFLSIILMLLCCAVPQTAPGQDRSSIPENMKWNLADIFATPATAVAARDQFAAAYTGISAHQGRLGDSAVSLYEALAEYMRLDSQISRLYTYANAWSDEDTQASAPLELKQTIEQLNVKFKAAASYLRPEILALPADKVRGFIAKEPRLKEYETYLDDILRWQPHTRQTSEEKIIAQASRMYESGENCRSIFTDAEMPYPEIVLSNGEKVRLDASGYSLHRGSSNRADRQAVFKAFWTCYQGFRRTMAASLYEQIKAHIFTKEARGFSSCLNASLFNYNIPENVYRELISATHANLPTLHRYLKLRQKMLGLDELTYEDVYPSLVTEVEFKYTPEEARDLVLESVTLLGRDYQATMKKGFDERWIDWLPSKGKRSGAYSTGVYEVHPYQLLNFNGRYDDVSTLAHEWGHSMHTYLSSKNQPYVTADYSLFVAEVASTLNENLLFHDLLERTTDDTKRLFLLGNQLHTLRSTLFRQTLFAEFELLIHEMAERGESLSAENLNALYLKLLRQYMGHDEGVCKIDELYAVEWAFIPHFFYNFYVYQYATSLTASITLEQKIRQESKATPRSTATREAYIKLLSSGSSKYPIQLLKDAGVDMTTSVPFDTSMKAMNAIMDQIEVILARQAANKGQR